MSLFPVSEFWWAYALFFLAVMAMLALDLGVFHRKAHEVSYKEAGAWTAVWILLALAFNLVGDALRDVLDPTQRGAE